MNPDADVIREALLRSEPTIAATDESVAAWEDAPAALDRLVARVHALERAEDAEARLDAALAALQEIADADASSTAAYVLRNIALTVVSRSV